MFPALKLRTLTGFALALIWSVPSLLPAQATDEPRPTKKEAGAATAPLYGKIVDEAGNPVTDAELTLQGPGYYRSKTDEEGRYQFIDATESGEYRLEVKSTRWAGITDYEKRPRVFIAADKSVEKNLTLPRACQIEIEVVDEQGDPIKGAHLYYASLAGERLRSNRTVPSNAEGRIIIGGLPPAETNFAIGSLNEGYAITHIVASTKSVEEVAKFKMVLARGGQVKGKAICSDGEPATGWRMVALPSGWRFGVSPGGETIGEDGSFELSNIGAGEYDLSISIPRGEGMSSSRPVLSGANLVEMNQPIQVKLDSPSPGSMNYITGNVRWIGKPFDQGFTITAVALQGSQNISQHFKAGTKEFRVGPASPGFYRVRVNHPDLEVINLRKIKNLADLNHVKLPNDKPLQIVLRVRGRPKLRGSVIDADTKQPIKRFAFRITKLQTLSGPNYVEDDQWRPVQDQQGQFQSEVNGPGVYQISVMADGYAVQSSETINTDESPDESVVVAMGRGVPFRGIVVDADGSPVDGARVMALSMAAGTMPRVMDRFVNAEGAVVTKNGEFAFEHLREGFDSFRVDHPDFVFAEVKAIKVSPQSPPLKITLRNGATVRGQVFDQQGRPEPNVTLFFQDANGYGGSGDREAGCFGQVTTDAEGRYAIEHIPAQLCYVNRAEEWRSQGVVRHALFPQDGKVHELNLGGRSKVFGKIVINGQPLANSRLQVGGNDSIFGAMKMYARTDDEGNFALYGAPPGHWTMYREIMGQRGGWSKVRELDAPAVGDLDLGVIAQATGVLTVNCTTNAAQVPERLRVQLRQYNPLMSFGRSTGKLLPRQTPDEPFRFADVSPGEYELVASGAGAYSVLQRIQVTKHDLQSPRTFDVPVGTATATIDLQGVDGQPASLGTLILCSDDGRIQAYGSPSSEAQKPGQFTFTDLPAANYEVRRGTDRNAEVMELFSISDGEHKQIELIIPEEPANAKGDARLTVYDDQGVIIPCQIQVTGEAGRLVQQRPYDTFVILVGPPGPITIRINHPGFEPIEQTIELQSDRPNAAGQKQQEVRLQLQRRQ